MKEYLKARLPELSSRIATVLPLIPMFFDLKNWQIGVLMLVSVLLFGVPEDKAIQMLVRKK